MAVTEAGAASSASKVSCAECKLNDLIAFTEKEDFSLKGIPLSVPVEFNICQKCGAESILPEQIKTNDAQLKSCLRKNEARLANNKSLNKPTQYFYGR